MTSKERKFIMKNIKRTISTVLCLCMILATLLAFTACNGGETPTPTDNTTVTVLVVAKDIEAGTKITEDMFKTVTTDISNVPFNAIRDAEKVKGMIATQKLYAGEFFFNAKLVDKVVDVDTEYSANLVVTEYFELGGDVADKIQALIDANPGRTLEFPDGEYIVSKPIKVSADCAKAVSLRLSSYAVIKAADNWSGDSAVICLADGKRNDASAVNSFYLQGGIVDGNGKAAIGVSANDARDILISNVTIRNATVGIKVIGGAVDIENVNIKATGAANSIGMLVCGDESSAANVQITNAETGVKVTGANNVFKSVNAKYSGTAIDSCGFIDEGTGSNYDVCQSYQFATGFLMTENTNSVYYSCYVTWTDATITRNWAFQSTGKFNSLIRTCSVDFAFAGHDASFIKAGAEGGAGQILYPMMGGFDNLADEGYMDYLQGTTVIVKPENEEAAS